MVVVLENHSYRDVIGNPAVPYLNRLARHGALFTSSHAITHPSQPNYLALFSGSTRGIGDDSCPHYFSARNLASQVLHVGGSFRGYAQGLPKVGYRGCLAGYYARKHAPWVNFRSVPSSTTRPVSDLPGSWSRLPTLSFVIPDLRHDMHNTYPGYLSVADRWVQRKLGSYATWAARHDSLLLLTFDEDDRSESNRIPTFFVGAHVRPGRYAEHVDHYRVLRTLEAAYGVPALGRAAYRRPITNVFSRS